MSLSALGGKKLPAFGREDWLNSLDEGTGELSPMGQLCEARRQPARPQRALEKLLMALVPVTVVEVRAWGRTVGLASGRGRSYDFEHSPEWRASGLEISPINLPTSKRGLHSSAGLNPETWHDLPPARARWGRLSSFLTETRLLEEGSRAQFMTRRFDRPVNGTRIHTQTLCGLSIVDYNQIEANDYAQLFQAIDALGLAQDTRDQAFRRLVSNWMAANCDDHTKNHSFLMTESGTWSLSPAYDPTHAHGQASEWTSKHLMGVNGKFRGIIGGI